MSAPPVPFELDEIFERSLATADPDAPLLTLHDVCVSFGGISALSGLNIDVGQHDVVAIIGPNGAGKTTLLNAISGIVSSSGSMMFNGQKLTGLSPSMVAARGIGRSFQDPPLVGHYSVLENVLCGAHLRMGYRMFDQIFRRRRVNAAERAMTHRAMVLLDFVGMAADARTPAEELAYGPRKLVDIARAMLSGPRLLMLDEPSSGLDAQERKSLETILLALRQEERVGILAVEHHMDLVRATATKVLALQAGQLLMSGGPAEVLDSDIFRDAVVGGNSAGYDVGRPLEENYDI